MPKFKYTKILYPLKTTTTHKLIIHTYIKKMVPHTIHYTNLIIIIIIYQQKHAVFAYEYINRYNTYTCITILRIIL